MSVSAIARQYGLTETAIRKRAKKDSWTRPLVDRVRRAVREKLVREDSSNEPRVSDAEVVEQASRRGFELVASHRKDIRQLHEIRAVLAQRLVTYLAGDEVDGPFIGERETAGDLLEKLARTTARLIPLERQAYNLDADDPAVQVNVGSGAIDALVKRLSGLADGAE